MTVGGSPPDEPQRKKKAMAIGPRPTVSEVRKKTVQELERELAELDAMRKSSETAVSILKVATRQPKQARVDEAVQARVDAGFARDLPSREKREVTKAFKEAEEARRENEVLRRQLQQVYDSDRVSDLENQVRDRDMLIQQLQQETKILRRIQLQQEKSILSTNEVESAFQSKLQAMSEDSRVLKAKMRKYKDIHELESRQIHRQQQQVISLQKDLEAARSKINDMRKAMHNIDPMAVIAKTKEQEEKIEELEKKLRLTEHQAEVKTKNLRENLRDAHKAAAHATERMGTLDATAGDKEKQIRTQAVTIRKLQRQLDVLKKKLAEKPAAHLQPLPSNHRETALQNAVAQAEHEMEVGGRGAQKHPKRSSVFSSSDEDESDSDVTRWKRYAAVSPSPPPRRHDGDVRAANSSAQRASSALEEAEAAARKIDEVRRARQEREEREERERGRGHQENRREREEEEEEHMDLDEPVEGEDVLYDDDFDDVDAGEDEVGFQSEEVVGGLSTARKDEDSHIDSRVEAEYGSEVEGEVAVEAAGESSYLAASIVPDLPNDGHGQADGDVLQVFDNPASNSARSSRQGRRSKPTSRDASRSRSGSRPASKPSVPGSAQGSIAAGSRGQSGQSNRSRTSAGSGRSAVLAAKEREAKLLQELGMDTGEGESKPTPAAAKPAAKPGAKPLVKQPSATKKPAPKPSAGRQGSFKQGAVSKQGSFKQGAGKQGPVVGKAPSQNVPKASRG